MYYRIANDTACKWCQSQQASSNHWRDINFARHTNCKCVIINTNEGTLDSGIKKGKWNRKYFSAEDFQEELNKSLNSVVNPNNKQDQVIYKLFTGKNKHKNIIDNYSIEYQKTLYEYTKNSPLFNDALNIDKVYSIARQEKALKLHDILTKSKVGEYANVKRAMHSLPDDIFKGINEEQKRFISSFIKKVDKQKLNTAVSEDFIEEIKLFNNLILETKGSSFTQKSFMSTSINEKTPKGFGKFIFDLDIDKNVEGLYIDSISHYSSKKGYKELELLINSGYRVDIEDVKVIYKIGDKGELRELEYIFKAKVKDKEIKIPKFKQSKPKQLKETIIEPLDINKLKEDDKIYTNSTGKAVFKSLTKSGKVNIINKNGKLQVIDPDYNKIYKESDVFDSEGNKRKKTKLG